MEVGDGWRNERRENPDAELENENNIGQCIRGIKARRLRLASYQSHLDDLYKPTDTIMKLAIIAATAALFVVASGSPTHNNGGDDALVPFAAAAPDSNPDDCFCQCKTLGYVDRWGTKHGNCKT